MHQLEQMGLDCSRCSGTCCTFEANSMMITPLEAFEILVYLNDKNLLQDDLKEELKKNRDYYRLDQISGNGKKSFLRRTYTCPFFLRSEFGCPLPKEVKPYGCLAFNSHHSEKKASEHCFSEREILEAIDVQFPEIKVKNEIISNHLNLNWKKQPIPVALLELWDQLELISKILN